MKTENRLILLLCNIYQHFTFWKWLPVLPIFFLIKICCSTEFNSSGVG